MEILLSSCTNVHITRFLILVFVYGVWSSEHIFLDLLACEALLPFMNIVGERAICNDTQDSGMVHSL